MITDEKLAMVYVIERTVPEHLVMPYLGLLLAEKIPGASVTVDWPALLGVDAPALREMVAARRLVYEADYEAERKTPGWMASPASQRIRVGLARRAAQGLPVGRLAGAIDKKPRRRAGYAARWDRERGR